MLIRTSKTEQKSAGAVVVFPYGEQSETRPVRAHALLAVLPDQRSAVFQTHEPLWHVDSR